MVTLSNGTQVEEYKIDATTTEARIVPDGRLMTEAEWLEYVTYVRSLNANQRKQRRAASRQAWERRNPDQRRA
jgi:hypothetical protein